MAPKLPIFLVLFSLFVSSAFSLRLLADDLINPYDDPRTQIRRCRQHCEQQGHGFQQTRQCKERCGSMSSDEDDAVLVSVVDRDFDQCQRRCGRQQGSQQQRQCFQRCDDRYSRQGDRDRRGSPSYEQESERDVPFQRRDPERRFQECRRRCQRQESGHQQRQCRDQCEEQLEREQQRGSRGSRFGRGDYDDDREGSRRFDEPQQRFRQCVRKCERQEQGGRMQSVCEQRCEQQLERQQGGSHRGEYLDEDEEMNPMGRDPAERRFEKCQSRCEEEYPRRGQEGESRRCQRKCEERFEEESEEGRPRGRQGERRCRQQCDRRGGGRQCKVRCERQFGDRRSPYDELA